MPTGESHFSGHLVMSHLGLAYVVLVETNPFQGLGLKQYLFDISIIIFDTTIIISGFDNKI